REIEAKVLEAAAKLEVLNGINSSISWKITAPLRHINFQFNNLKSILKKSLRGASVFLMNQLRRPKIKKSINKFLLKYPKLREKLLVVVHRCTKMPLDQSRYAARSKDMTVGDLTLRGREIYLQLKKSMANK